MNLIWFGFPLNENFICGFCVLWRNHLGASPIITYWSLWYIGAMEWIAIYPTEHAWIQTCQNIYETCQGWANLSQINHQNIRVQYRQTQTNTHTNLLYAHVNTSPSVFFIRHLMCLTVWSMTGRITVLCLEVKVFAPLSKSVLLCPVDWYILLIWVL